MVRSYWIGPLFGAMAMTGLAWGQTVPSVAAPAVETQERFVNVQEAGKPGQRCKILKMWIMANGVHAYQVQAVDTGELMTIEDADATAPPQNGLVRSATMRIFHTGRSNQGFTETPEPPSGAVVIAQPSEMRSTTKAPPVMAAKALAPSGPLAAPVKWPSAFAQAKPRAPTSAETDQNTLPSKMPALASKDLTAPKRVELTPLASTPAAAKPALIEPIASVSVKPTEMNSTHLPVAVVQTMEPKATAAPAVWSPYSPTPVDRSVVQNTAASKATAPSAVVVNGSPYGVQTVDGSTFKAPEYKATPPPATVITGSPYAPNPVNGAAEVIQGPAIVHWNTETPKTQPAPRIVVQETKSTSKTVIVKSDDCECSNPVPAGKVAPTTSVGASSFIVLPPPPPMKEAKPAVAKAPMLPAKVETTPAQPSDWRESWGKLDGPKPSPKVELPHAEARADDPLKSPDKYSKVPPGAGPDAPVADKKAPFLALLAHDQPPAVKPEVKTPLTALPPVPGPTTEALTKPPVGPAAAVAETKPAKPAAPLGMGSVLAARSPELAPPAPAASPKAGSQGQAMGVNANEPNAFTDYPKGGTATVATNAFGAPQNPAPVNSEADALASNAFPPRAPTNPAYGAPAMRTPTPTAAVAAPSMPTSYVVAANFNQPSIDLSQLTALLRGSLYPSQREWAVESLATLDWRKQPQVLDLIVERAKQDPAPTVRAECMRSLGRMKADTAAVVAVVKALQADEDSRVRQEAVEAFANLSGAPAH